MRLTPLHQIPERDPSIFSDHQRRQFLLLGGNPNTGGHLRRGHHHGPGPGHHGHHCQRHEEKNIHEDNHLQSGGSWCADKEYSGEHAVKTVPLEIVFQLF